MKNILTVGVGQSKDPEEAIKKAVSESGKPDLVIAYFSSDLNPDKVYNVIRSNVGEKANIIGGTTAGEYSSVVDKPQTGTVAVMTIRSYYLKVGIGVGKDMKEHPFNSGKEAIKQAYTALKNDPTTDALMSLIYINKDSSSLLKVKPFIGLVLLDGMSGQEEEFLKGVIDGGTIPIVGGSTGDDLKFKQTFELANGVYSNAGVVAVLNRVLKMGVGYGHPYFPTKKGAVVTKADGRIVYELNNQPAEKVMKELLEVDALTPEILAQKPMGVRSLDIYGEYAIRSAMKPNGDGSVTFYARVDEGQYLTVMGTNKDYAVESFKKALNTAIKKADNPKEIGAVIIFNCILRHLLKERLGINDMEIIRQEIGDIPMIGFNTYGEQGITRGGALGHYNQTSTILVIGKEIITQ